MICSCYSKFFSFFQIVRLLLELASSVRCVSSPMSSLIQSLAAPISRVNGFLTF